MDDDAYTRCYFGTILHVCELLKSQMSMIWLDGRRSLLKNGLPSVLTYYNVSNICTAIKGYQRFLFFSDDLVFFVQCRMVLIILYLIFGICEGETHIKCAYVCTIRPSISLPKLMGYVICLVLLIGYST